MSFCFIFLFLCIVIKYKKDHYIIKNRRMKVKDMWNDTRVNKWWFCFKEMNALNWSEGTLKTLHCYKKNLFPINDVLLNLYYSLEDPGKKHRVFTTILSSTAVFIMKTRVMAAENSALHHRSKFNCKIYQIEVILNFNRFLLYFWLNKYSLVEHMRLLSKTLNTSYQPQTFEQRISCLEI